jgi:hypothetical protein
MQKVPFFANTPDDTHCVQAAFKMMLKYFMPERDFSFNQLDKLSRKEPSKGTWWLPLLLELSKLEISVKDIEPFNYTRFYKEGDTYVKSFYPPQAANYHLNQTNLRSIKPLIPEFLKNVDLETRSASLDDIQKMLASGWLIAAAVNSRVLNNTPGFSGHVMVVYDFDAKSGQFLLHDPGLPAHESRPVAREKFEAALFSAGPQTAAVAALKKA